MHAEPRPFSLRDRVYAVKTWHDGSSETYKGKITDISTRSYYVLPDGGTIGDWYEAADLKAVGDDAAYARVRAECQGLSRWQLIEMIVALREPAGDAQEARK